MKSSKRRSELIVTDDDLESIQILAETTSEDDIFGLIKKRGELAAFQMHRILKIPRQTIDGALRRLEVKGRIKSRKVRAKVDGVTRIIRLYKVKGK